MKLDKNEMPENENINMYDCVGKGIDGIDFTWKMTDVEKNLGLCENTKEYEDKKFDSSSVYMHYYQKGFSLLFINKQFSTIFLYSGVVYGYEKGLFNKYLLDTKLNISFETEIDEIKNIYGEPLRVNENKYAPVPYSTYSYKGFALDINLNEQRIGCIIIKNS